MSSAREGIKDRPVNGLRRQRAQATAEQLLAAAREVFEERGYAGTTVAHVTERADCAHGTFYLYFKNKEDAFARVMADVIAELAREADAPWTGDALEATRASVAGHFAVVQRHRGLWRCLMQGMLSEPSIEEMWLDLRRPFVDRIERGLRAHAARGLTRAIDTQAAAVALGSMVEWTAFTILELEEPAGIAVDAAVEGIADLWFHAVFGRIDAA